MPNTTPASDAIDSSALPVRFDTRLELITKKALFEALPNLRFMAWAKKNIKHEYNVKRKSIMWDRDDSTPPWQLKNWADFTPINADIYNFRRRSEMLFDVKHSTTATEELTSLETGDQQFRDTNKMNLQGMLEWFPKLVNDQLTQGDGVLYQEGTHPCQRIHGYQTVLANSYTGNYAKVPVPTNESQQYAIVDGDTGPNTDFHDDAITMIKRLLRATQVDIAGKRYRANVLFTGLDTIGFVEEAYDASGMARIVSNSGKEHSDIDLGTTGMFFYRTPLLEDETIGATPNIYALDSKCWSIYSSFPQLFNVEKKRRINNVVGEDFYHTVRYRLSLVCHFLRAQGVLHYDA